MTKKNAATNSSVRYHKLTKTDDGFIDLQSPKAVDNNADDIVEDFSDSPEVPICPVSFFLPLPKPSLQSRNLFQKPESKVPWKAILLAVFLFIMGTSLIVLASLLFTGYINGKHSEGSWPLLILGSLMFIPGFYHVRIAYYAYRQYPGYSFDDIPDFD